MNVNWSRCGRSRFGAVPAKGDFDYLLSGAIALLTKFLGRASFMYLFSHVKAFLVKISQWHRKRYFK